MLLLLTHLCSYQFMCMFQLMRTIWYGFHNLFACVDILTFTNPPESSLLIQNNITILLQSVDHEASSRVLTWSPMSATADRNMRCPFFPVKITESFLSCQDNRILSFLSLLKQREKTMKITFSLSNNLVFIMVAPVLHTFIFLSRSSLCDDGERWLITGKLKSFADELTVISQIVWP